MATERNTVRCVRVWGKRECVREQEGKRRVHNMKTVAGTRTNTVQTE